MRGESLVAFQPALVGNLPAADWVFFYSKTGVRFFFQQVGEQVKNCRFAAMGPGTATELERWRRNADFTGDGDPASVAAAFLAVAAGQRVLFVRARDSRRSVQVLLDEKVTVYDLVVYENTIRTDFDPLPPFDCLVFTSPLNVGAFFAKQKPLPYQRIVAIGKTTAEALQKNGVEKMEIAESPAGEGLAGAVEKALSDRTN